MACDWADLKFFRANAKATGSKIAVPKFVLSETIDAETSAGIDVCLKVYFLSQFAEIQLRSVKLTN